MPAVKNVLRHLSVEVAKRKRQCWRNRSEHVILKGDRCLVIHEGQECANYCIPCAKEILAVANGMLLTLDSELVIDEGP